MIAIFDVYSVRPPNSCTMGRVEVCLFDGNFNLCLDLHQQEQQEKQEVLQQTNPEFVVWAVKVKVSNLF